jgi:hypothetical protein
MNTQVAETVTRIFQMDNRELDQVIAAVKQRRTWLAKDTARSIQAGQTVSFENRNQTVLGTVKKVNPKNILVRENSTQTVWRVPANMLTIHSN